MPHALFRLWTINDTRSAPRLLRNAAISLDARNVVNCELALLVTSAVFHSYVPTRRRRAGRPFVAYA